MDAPVKPLPSLTSGIPISYVLQCETASQPMRLAVQPLPAREIYDPVSSPSASENNHPRYSTSDRFLRRYLVHAETRDAM